MKTIVLAETRWTGHHPTYFREFTASLLRNGTRVITLCPDPKAFKKLLSADCETGNPRLFCGKLTDSGKSILFPGRDHDPLTTFLRWRRMAKAVKTAEKQTGWRSDLVFFPYLDAWIRFLPFPLLPRRILGRPWSGLYFRCAHLGEKQNRLARLAKGDAILCSPDCVAVGTLDEKFSDQIAAVSGKRVLPWPDITDEETPTPPSDLALKIAEKADGRPIIGMVSLSKRKGLLTLMRIAEAARENRDWFFAFAGPFHHDFLTSEERSFVERTTARNPDNLHIDLTAGRVNDGRDFNSLINLFDIVYAAYEDFQGSSNALTKAALFGKPVIASMGGTIGNRVEHFGIGRVIPERDALAGELAIDELLGEQIDPSRFSTYLEFHDLDRLDAVFTEVIGSLAAATPPSMDTLSKSSLATE